MPSLSVGADCGNSPKKTFLRDLNIAFAEADVAAISAALEEMRVLQAAALTIHAVITHGSEGAVNGEITMADGSR
ncbi:MAG: hypothetical protein ACFB51_04975 [Anaerolineae bacterium]